MAFGDMTVLARTKSGAGRIRRHREGRPGRVAGRGDAPTTPGKTVIDETTAATRRRRREAGMSEDQAVYTCECGFVFEALVSTSVDCPNCGGSQA
jgi:hypothetical protein